MPVISSHPPRRGDYGVDAPYAPILMIIGGCCLLTSLIMDLIDGPNGHAIGAYRFSIIARSFGTLWIFIVAGCFLYSTRIGKFREWANLLDRLDLKGDERVLDIGCGRGAVLLMAAQRLTKGGKAVGVDIWSKKDQYGNAEEVTRRNAELEGVADRIELHTADMRQLPFADGSADGGFDVVLSSRAIHNISGSAERAKAIREAARVLKKGGKLMIADVLHTRAHARELQACGLTIIEPGRPFWSVLIPWSAIPLVVANKP